jgi:phenylalanyl-tRNA synthetase beta chain
MKVSYQWLSEYVDLSGYTARELAEKLTRSGIEVDFVEKLNKGVSSVVVGYVTEKEKHPNADKLNVCKVDVGGEEDLQIVCGAPNVDVGQKVPVAVVGAVLPGDFKIKRAKLRGTESQGMICSAKELGLNDRLLPKEIQEGILVLPEQISIGTSIEEVLDLNDEIMELDLTPNRSDCLSMIGTAYEIAAILGREVKLPQSNIASAQTKTADQIKVNITAEAECQHYAARLIEGIKIGPSPLWLQNRLMAAGIRPINNVVDITNYVMLEYGQPLHAFDADALNQGQIEVRLAQSGEKITTLDDVERTLEASMLLITDGQKPIAIAGVMGGANSEVNTATKRILLESARFSGPSVRKTSRELGLRSESSLRFEKEVNPEAVIPALNRAAALMAELAEGQAAEGIVEAKTDETSALKLDITAKRINKYLGTAIAVEDIAAIFDRLHFKYSLNKEAFNVEVPARRGDITRDVDLIEEVARLFGYDEIPTTLIQGVTTPGALKPSQSIRRGIRKLLSDSGIHEAITYTFTQKSQNEGWPGLFEARSSVALAMPMSEERAVLRTSLIPHLMDAATYNRNRNMNDIALFEIGTAFITQEQAALTKLPNEKPLLAILWTGRRQSEHWAASKDRVDFYDLKGLFEKVTHYLGIEDAVQFDAAEITGMHPGRTAAISIQSGEGLKSIGFMGQLHPDVQKVMDLEDTYILEVELEPIYTQVQSEIMYQGLPRYPSITRDIAVVVNQDIPVGKLLSHVREAGGALLVSADVFDIYRDERIGTEKQSVALSLVYRHHERTLTDEEVTEQHKKVVDMLEKSFAAELRK